MAAGLPPARQRGARSCGHTTRLPDAEAKGGGAAMLACPLTCNPPRLRIKCRIRISTVWQSRDQTDSHTYVTHVRYPEPQGGRGPRRMAETTKAEKAQVFKRLRAVGPNKVKDPRRESCSLVGLYCYVSCIHNSVMIIIPRSLALFYR